MHSVKRERASAKAREEKRRREAGKIVEYKALVDKVLGSRKNQDYTPGTLDLTTTLLKQNPEYYTVWNYRREILTSIFKSQTADAIQSHIDNELQFLFARLVEFPKCYWIWNHRQWCLQTAPSPSWKFELGLVTKMLDRDARNFHGWRYRRYVVQRMEMATGKSMVRPEFDYTTVKINSNFSNFSAWHNRTKLIPRLLNEEPEIDARELLDKEIYLITQAIYTDPDDQSVWLYHRWLMTSDDIVKLSRDERIGLLEKEIKSIHDLLEIEPDSKWCLQSLAFYKGLLATLAGQKVDSSVAGYLDKLQDIDPMRKKRYEDWKELL
ncbi:hypothetical protein POJ06DRAFT_274672 [Lipomyces tetrasporus]|uniref:Geranylgeranyl transferase type-2 subunit alpha n=1 Tax=Lipomyces tetrasporus TaxID=54092 RepID=A0AAD7VTM4_9ASCO|nr:uncharacterized protein POJ06DRAFT_274672 [Lipomyces tetrasporus]KAJ8100899.1 hypothetical protein POJ06DRAFT_274672 [Lipomyces tetrasporus]